MYRVFYSVLMAIKIFYLMKQKERNKSSRSLNSVYIYLYVCMCVSCSVMSLCDPMDCGLPASSVHGILQVRIVEWVALSFEFSYLANSFFKKNLMHKNSHLKLNIWDLVYSNKSKLFYSPFFHKRAIFIRSIKNKIHKYPCRFQEVIQLW